MHLQAYEQRHNKSTNDVNSTSDLFTNGTNNVTKRLTSSKTDVTGLHETDTTVQFRSIPVGEVTNQNEMIDLSDFEESYKLL